MNYSIVFKIIFSILSCVGILMPSVLHKQKNSIIYNSNHIINENKEFSINNKYKIIFNLQHEIVGIINTYNNINLLELNEKIKFETAENYSISCVNNIITLSNNDKYIKISIKNDMIVINSNFTNELTYIRVKSSYNHESLLFQTNSKYIYESDINRKYNLTKENKSKYSVISLHSPEYIYCSQTLRSFMMFHLNSEFTHMYLSESNKQQSIVFKNSDNLHNVSIRIIPNEIKELSQHTDNVRGFRNYGFLSFIAIPLASFFENIITNYKFIGFCGYLLVNLVILFVLFNIEQQNAKIENAQNKEIQLIENDNLLSSEIKEETIKHIHTKYKKSLLTTITSSMSKIIPSVLQLLNIFYIIPYCLNLKIMNIFGINLGLRDLIIHNKVFSLPTFSIVIFSLYVIKCVLQYNNKKDNTNLLFEGVFLIMGLVYTTNDITANVIYWITSLICKDIVAYIWSNKSE